MKCLLEGSSGLKDIFDQALEANAKNARKSKEKSATPFLRGSISNYSKDLIMTFPTLCDNSLPPSTASMLSKANERNIVTMLQLLFSSAQLQGSEGAKILATIHQNIRTNLGIDDYIDAVDAYIANVKESTLTQRDINVLVTEMVKALKESDYSFPVNSFSEKSLNDYTVYNRYGTSVVKEISGPGANPTRGSKKSMDFDYTPDMIAKMTDDELKKAINKLKLSGLQKDYNNSELKRSMDKLQFDMRKQEYQQMLDELEKRNSPESVTKDKNEMRKLSTQTLQGDVDILSKQLMDSDVKKNNELEPTLMIVKFYKTLDNGEVNEFDQQAFVAGVKSRLISVDSSDIIERIIAKNKTKINFLNFIRATTGEIKFLKDFVLCIDQAKIDAKNGVKKGPAAKMWKVLETRSIKNNMNKLRRAGNDASAITTLIINQETANILKKEYNFDIEIMNNATMILNAYNLLGIMIADESINVVKILYAGNDTWETQAYSYLEKESNDNSYKKIINLLNKQGR